MPLLAPALLPSLSHGAVTSLTTAQRPQLGGAAVRKLLPEHVASGEGRRMPALAPQQLPLLTAAQLPRLLECWGAEEPMADATMTSPSRKRRVFPSVRALTNELLLRRGEQHRIERAEHRPMRWPSHDSEARPERAMPLRGR